MTYMFENPTYHPITMPEDIQNRYLRYSLYSYCEGVRCEAHRRNQFSGIKYFVFFLKNYFCFFPRLSCFIYSWRPGSNSYDFEKEGGDVFSKNMP